MPVSSAAARYREGDSSLIGQEWHRWHLYYIPSHPLQHPDTSIASIPTMGWDGDVASTARRLRFFSGGDVDGHYGSNVAKLVEHLMSTGTMVLTLPSS